MANLGSDYITAGFGNVLGFGKHPALLVVDFVKAYLTPESPLYAGVEDALVQARQVLVACRKAEVPVLFSVVKYIPGGVDGGLFYKKVGALRLFDRGSPLSEIAAELVPEPGEIVFSKQYASAFFGTSLASTLRVLGVDTLIHVGVSTSGCIRATAVDCLQHGFRPIVVRDGVGDRDLGPHEANLFDLEAKYADVMTASEVIRQLGSPASGSDC